MVASVLCPECTWNHHHPDEERGHTQPGVLGGWACCCPCRRGDIPPDRPTPMDRLMEQCPEFFEPPEADPDSDA